MRNSAIAVLLATIGLAIVVDSGAQAPVPAVKPPVKAAPAQPPAGTAPQSPGRVGMGALLDQFTTLEDRDISVLVTSGDESTLSSQMADRKSVV